MSIPTDKSFGWEKVAGMVAVLALVGQIGYWGVGKAYQTDSTATALTAANNATTLALGGVNSRLDRLFEKVDGLTGRLPVIEERLSQALAQVTEGKGAYASLDLRLRAIENNAAANHEDIQKVGPRRTP